MRTTSGRVTHVRYSGETESSGSHQATHDSDVDDDESTSDDDAGVNISDPLATELGDIVASDGLGSTSSNTSKRKKSGRGPGKVPEPTAIGSRPVISLSGDA